VQMEVETRNLKIVMRNPHWSEVPGILP
jgi:hypothetical protein